MKAAVYAVCMIGMCQPLLAQQDEPSATEKPPAKRVELEKRFAETMTGAELIGHYTVAGSKENVSPNEERYSISKATKQKDDYWLFQVRIRYADHDLTLPLLLQVKWAGDTPVITLTDLAIPVLGTFTARVLIYRDQYAGTWSGGDHGGQLFGRIEHPADAKARREDTASGEKKAAPDSANRGQTD